MTDTERRLAAVTLTAQCAACGHEAGEHSWYGPCLVSLGNYDDSCPCQHSREQVYARALLPVVAEIEAEARAGERERVAAAIAGSCRRGFGMSPDGTEDPTAAAYVEGLRDAWAIARTAEGSLSAQTAEYGQESGLGTPQGSGPVVGATETERGAESGAERTEGEV